jgi:hypothetical protein
MTTDPLARTTIAAALLIVPVAAEIAFPERFDVASGLLVFAATQLAGWALVWSVVRNVRPGHSRRARFGRRAVLIGVMCEMAFATVYGATALDAEPFEWSFVLFSLGFLALAVGGPLWGSSLLRQAGLRTAGGGLVATGVLGLLAIVMASDPWHDIFLLTSYAVWPVVGSGLRAETERATELTEPLVSGGRGERR